MSLPLSVCVCWSLLGGRVVGCIMQEAGDEPSQEGGWIEMRHSMTCFRGECIIQHRSSNLIPSLRYCRVFTVKNIWKIWFVSHWGTLICAAATPPLVSQNTCCNHNNSSRKRHLSSSSASLNPPVSPSSATLPLSWPTGMVHIKFRELMLAVARSHRPADAHNIQVQGYL